MFFTYVIESELTGRFYIGQTNDLAARVLRHNKGRVPSTKSERPWILIYYKGFETRSQAMRLEQRLKRFKKRVAVMKFFDEQ